MYNKLFSKILDSSIWLQPAATRIVWVTFIAVMDEDGFVPFASIANVAHRAVVTLEEAQAAIRCLEGPDPDSSDPAHEGRRIERVPGGWIVLNAAKHRELVTRAVAREHTRERVRRHRERQVDTCNPTVTPRNAAIRSVTQSVSVSEAVSEGAVAPTAPPQTAVKNPTPKPLAYKPRIDVAWPGHPPVPSSLHADFIDKLGGDKETARRRLLEWYPAAAAPYDGQPIGDDDFRFWRARFREWIGTTVKPLSPQAEPRATDDEIWADIQAQKALRKANR